MYCIRRTTSASAEMQKQSVQLYDMGLTAANFKNESANFSNVIFEVTDGYMEITPAGDAVVVTIDGKMPAQSTTEQSIR